MILQSPKQAKLIKSLIMFMIILFFAIIVLKIANPNIYEKFFNFEYIINTIKEPVPIHIHTDIQLIFKNKKYPLSNEKFQSTNKVPLSYDVHLHNFNANVLHYHLSQVNLIDFFESIGFILNKNCIITNEGTSYCNDNLNKLFLFVNGKKRNKIKNYYPKDLDKVLLYFGKKKDAVKYLDKITNKACVYSEKCEATFNIGIEPCSASDLFCSKEFEQAVPLKKPSVISSSS